MATLSNLTCFQDGVIASQNVLGTLNDSVYHLRYQLDLDANEAGSELSVQIGGTNDDASIYWVNDGGGTQTGFDNRLNNDLKFCCAISEDADEFINVDNAPSDNQLIISKHPWGNTWYIASCDSIKYNLHPGKTYYLWLYPVAPYSYDRLGWVNGAEKILAISGTLTYVINYDANGGSGAPATQTKTHGIKIKLSDEAPTRTGYTFIGWATSKSGSAVAKPGDNYAKDADLTLYAVWQINQYTDTFDPNGGIIVGDSSFTGNYNTPYVAPGAERTGYTFVGWSTTASGGTIAGGAGASVRHVAENRKFYAQWTPNKYTLTVSPMGGTFSDGTTENKILELTFDSTDWNNISTITPTFTHYTLRDWGDADTGSTIYNSLGECVNDGVYWLDGRYIYPSDLTIFARVIANTYTITYDANGGSGVPEAQTGKYAYEIALSSEIPTRYGYVFKGWCVDKYATIDDVLIFEPGCSYLVLGSETLYAIWKPINLVAKNCRACIKFGDSVVTCRAIVRHGELDTKCKPTINNSDVK